MPKKMLINTMHPEEARVAIVEDGRLVELDVEVAGSEQTRGNVYKGVVVRVEPGLQAAFIDIGLKKLGFLQVGELHPDCWQWRDDVPEEQRKRRPRIQEVLRRGQEIVVQVEKGERDMKGAALTTYLSLPGRYMVLMPGSDSSGVSRKVENDAERKKLKEMAAELPIPEGVGYIMRTEALGKKKTELSKDLQSLLKLHKEMLARASKTKAPALIYKESDLVIRTIRDYFTAEIDEVLVDSPEVFQEAQVFFKANMPKYAHVLKLHQEKRPIFSKYQLEEQIDQIYEKKVLLKSGGSLVIEPTEALVSIDVNSGKSTGERGVEDTAFKTNIEAAEEVARQLRLRDLGGLIVIDFIDMRDKKHMTEVEKTLKNALKTDKARVTVGRISQFGMLEMSRQRIKQTLDQGSVLECPHCAGRGKVKSAESMALSFLRKVHGAAAKGSVAEVRGELPLEVAYYLLNRKKQELARIERDYDIEVTVKGKPSFLMNQLETDLIKREKPLHLEHAEQIAESLPVAAAGEEGLVTAPPAVSAAQEEKGKKKRRKGKKEKEEGAATVAAEELPLEAVSPAPGEEIPAPEGLPPAEGEPEGGKRKRRRRRRRGKSHSHEPSATAVEPEAVAPAEAEQEPEQEVPALLQSAEGDHAEAVKKKRRRRRKRKQGTSETGTTAAVETVAVPDAAAAPTVEEVPAPAEIPPAAPKLRRVGTRRKREELATDSVQESVPEAPVVSPEEPPAKKSKRSTRAKAALPQPEPEPQQAAPAPEEDVLPKPRTRKKKAPEQETAVQDSGEIAEEKPRRKRSPRAAKPEA